MKDIKLNLIPSCSEYTSHIILTPKEIEFVKKIMEIKEVSELDHILEHFGYSEIPLNKNSDVIIREGPSGFIEQGLLNDYEYLRDLVLKIRKKEKTEDEVIKELEMIYK